MIETKFNFKDILLVPAASGQVVLSDSVNVYQKDERFDIARTLPLMNIPSESIISSCPDRNQRFNPNVSMTLVNAGIRPCSHLGSSDGFRYYTPEIVNEYFIKIKNTNPPTNPMCIMASNGDAQYLVDMVYTLKKRYPDLSIMVGPIGNPYSYKALADAGADYVIVGLPNKEDNPVGYPLASLIHACNEILPQQKRSKLVAAGRFDDLASLIKALALGADYVMLGGALLQSLESDNTPYAWKIFPIRNPSLASWLFKRKIPLYKKVEEIGGWLRVAHTLESWVSTFGQQLQRAMADVDATTLTEFREKSTFIRLHSL